MTTRITQSMLNQNMLYNLQRNNSEMAKYQEQASTGKKVSRPSDDPVTAVRGMFYRSSLNEIEQFKRNASDGISYMEATDAALDEVTNVMHRVRELTVKGLNGTNGSTDRYAISAEIKELKEHIGEIANTQMSGKYIFAGTDTQNPPFTNGEFDNNNGTPIEVQVGQSNSVVINVLGKDVFDHDDVGSLFSLLDDISKNFEEGTANDDHLKQLDLQLDNILRERSELGARMNRMELSLSRIDGLELSTTEMLSKEEDVDIARVIIDLKAQENVQRAALSIGARIIQPSLVDFLR